jgi:hypothetical protein
MIDAGMSTSSATFLSTQHRKASGKKLNHTNKQDVEMF